MGRRPSNKQILTLRLSRDVMAALLLASNRKAISRNALVDMVLRQYLVDLGTKKIDAILANPPEVPDARQINLFD
jgi:hypothetical protein